MSVTIKSKMKYHKDDIVVHGTIYHDQSPALILTTVDGEPLGKASINFTEQDGVNLSDMAVVIKDYSENEGVLQTLIEGGIIELNGTVIRLPHDWAHIANIVHFDIIDEVLAAKKRVA